ncbi:hypothetical protein TDMWS_06620 [Thermodesulfomicrobium sp. WS]|uniref:hypothetical protein n=1 Tax=Thermodesulfomicrobium sp. WS TaxID=3004129 RepID=UPI0024905817|nr:hypothetical protein [Thermodesulfomicrobium sp. WS]BDV00577.1 hypothetical protein TDMWS_06620 [Thermodesulfomicrobium sp. WS]
MGKWVDRICEIITFLFDPLHHFWESEGFHRRAAALLVVVFLAALAGIELGRQGLLPPVLAQHTPANHFHAVNLAFTLVLILEVVSFLFTLPCSFSKSLGTQFEILALILLRNAFKELSLLGEPITVEADLTPVLHLAAYGFGALILFALLGIFRRIQPKHKKDTLSATALYRFVAIKKAIALVLLTVFVGFGLTNAAITLAGLPHVEFFPFFYTLLVFTDILIVLVAQYFWPSFQAVFRNSGYALATVFIRLALAAPPVYDVALAILAIVFAIALNLVWDRVFTGFPAQRPETTSPERTA